MKFPLQQLKKSCYQLRQGMFENSKPDVKRELIRTLILSMLGLRCLLGIKVEMSNKHWIFSLELERESVYQHTETHLGVRSTRAMRRAEITKRSLKNVDGDVELSSEALQSYKVGEREGTSKDN